MECKILDKKIFFSIISFIFLVSLYGTYSAGAGVDEPGAASTPGLSIQYKCGSEADRYQSMRPYIVINNNTGATVSMSDIKVRYYYFKEGIADETFMSFYTTIGIANVTGKFLPEKGYAEFGFTSGAGSISDGGNSGQIQLVLKKVTNGFYEQSNDYSYSPKILEYTDYDKMTLYYKDELVWGKEGPLPPPKPVPPPSGDDWLNVDGNLIKDKKGKVVHLTGINWFGFETDGANGFYGLNKCNLEDSLKLMADCGFNILRIPMSAEIIKEWKNGKYVNTSFVNTEENPNLDGMNSLQILDYTVEHCRMTGMKIIFDMHGYKKDSYQEPLWYDASFTMKDFIASWEWLTQRYKDDDTVIAMDLKNEPHGKYNGPKVAKWDDSSDPNNWKKAAEDIGNAVLKINPNLLILVEGVEAYPMEGYDYTNNGEFTTYFNWWGGNLRGVAENPVKLSVPGRLIYSPHEYGPDIYMQPWFKKTFDIDTLYNDTWYPNWYYIVDKGIAPVLIGEWGGKLANATNKKWFGCIAEFIAKKQLNHTFWSFNPNSADTGGLMLEDWKTVDEEKYNIIKQTLWMKGLDHAVPLGGAKQSGSLKISGYISPEYAASKAGFKVELESTSISALADESGYFELSTDIKAATASLKITKNGYLSRTVQDIILSSISGNIEISTEEVPLKLWVGDFNGDNAINMMDITSVAKVFNSSRGDGRYLEKFDVNQDKAINFEDIVIIARHFNKSSKSYDS